MEIRLSDGISQNPAAIMRLKRPDGRYLYTDEECYRLTEVWLQRAIKLWETKNKKELEKETRRKLEELVRLYTKPSKVTGRGKTFWVDSE
jgi:hypothetical protein